ncbi:MAG: hypothetical protein KAX73_01080, partial [Aquabacterium sp.]|nr:hypothetical protein [Aquabacterium sp.]
MELAQMDQPHRGHATRWHRAAHAARTCVAGAVLLALGLAGGVQAQVGAQISLPNGYMTTQGPTLSFASSGGGGGARSAGSSNSGGSGGGG